MALVYTPFENDKTTDNAQTAPLTADAKATLTPDIASGDDGVESDSQFKTENVKNAVLTPTPLPLITMLLLSRITQ